MLRMILLLGFIVSASFSMAQTTELINVMSGENFDLRDYSIDSDAQYGPDAGGGAYFYELIDVDYIEGDSYEDYLVTVTLKKKWLFGFQTQRSDTKKLSLRDWRSRIYARNGQQIEMGTLQYIFNEQLSAGGAIMQESNWSGDIPRGKYNPAREVYVGATVRFILK